MLEWTMDRWKYFDITHRNHLICNPMTAEKLDELFSLMHLKSGARVLDIASGKGEVLVRLAESYGIRGVGVDLSPFAFNEAEKKTPGKDSRLGCRVPADGRCGLSAGGAGFL